MMLASSTATNCTQIRDYTKTTIKQWNRKGGGESGIRFIAFNIEGSNKWQNVI
ncbi:hypothetical protein DPMN_075323 [Dreissena polymorpha]|uniref:Uncharacterized protein n=1 Tax=Dreissena polymorpha TaxID=45954 RepID=A0A9D3YGY7_DREPO|nr:hypothetical protein DPMN_075323 [Dreissena polymorpha]